MTCCFCLKVVLFDLVSFMRVSKGFLKLPNGLKVHKAPGPDGLSARVLK